MSRFRLLGKTIPWLCGAIYLLLIANLGLLFHQIDDYKISEVELVSADAPPTMVPLTFVSSLKEGRLEDEPGRMSIRHPFAVADDSDQLAVFIPRLSADVQLSINKVAVRAPWQSYRAEEVNRPLFIPVPPELLRNDEPNELLLELIGFGPALLLSEFYLGPQETLEPGFRYFDTFRHGLIRISFTVTLVFAIFMGTIWMVRRQFNEYGWLSLAFLAFSYYLLLFMRDTQVIHFELQIWSFLLARAIFICAFVFFIHQFLGLRRRRLEMAIVGFFGLIFSIGLVLVLRHEYRPFLSLTYFTSLPMVLLLIGYITTLLAMALGKTGHVYLHWLLVGSLLGLVLGIHDLMVVFDAQHWLFRDFFISHYASVFMAIGFGGVLVHRVAHALFNSEDLNLELKRLLEQKSLALESASQQQLQQEKQLALYAERQRIIADMHDGVGGQLVGLLAANRNEPLDQSIVNHELDQILADLRLVLDALTPAGEELLAAMARLKERYTQLLNRAGCQLDWQIDPTIQAIPMQPSLTINILRLIQEAIQNSLKHAQAETITVSLTQQDSGYRLTIADDGVGIGIEDCFSTDGFGTQTMQKRADAVAGQLSISSPDEGGTEVSLQFDCIGNLNHRLQGREDTDS